MRFSELFESDYNDDLRSEIITLLTAVSAEGIDTVETKNLLNDLEHQGYAVDEQSLLELLGDLDIVSSANADTIDIATSDVDMMVGKDAEEVKADRVNDMATKQATDSLKDSVQFDSEDDQEYVWAESVKRMSRLAGIKKG